MKQSLRFVLWLSVLAVAAWSLVYFLQHFPSTSFQEGAMGNLFATILGLVVGIPIALELNRQQQHAQNILATATRTAEETQRKGKVLSLIHSELRRNKEDVIRRRKPIETGGKREVHTGGLRDEMWSAFSDGGELQHVNSPEVLAAIAGAYYEIRSNIHLEHGYMEATHFAGMRVHQDKYPQDWFLEYITNTDEQLLGKV
jgi:hypothetical protein